MYFSSRRPLGFLTEILSLSNNELAFLLGLRHQIPCATWKMFSAKNRYHWTQSPMHFTVSNPRVSALTPPQSSLCDTETMKLHREAAYSLLSQWQRGGSPKERRTCVLDCLFILRLHKIQFLRFVTLGCRMSEHAKKCTILKFNLYLCLIKLETAQRRGPRAICVWVRRA